MSFNLPPTKRVFRVGRYDGIDDFVVLDLSGEKRPVVQFLIGEFHPSVICKSSNPLVAHSAPPNGDSGEIIRAFGLKTCKFLQAGASYVCFGRIQGDSRSARSIARLLSFQSLVLSRELPFAR